MFQCLQSWVRHVDVPGDELAGNPLLPAAFDALKNAELFETAVDLLVEVRKRRVSNFITYYVLVIVWRFSVGAIIS